MARAKGTLKSGVRILGLRCCEDKERYSEAEAEEQLRILKINDPRLVKYGPCVGCGSWHIGHKTK